MWSLQCWGDHVGKLSRLVWGDGTRKVWAYGFRVWGSGLGFGASSGFMECGHLGTLCWVNLRRIEHIG